MRHNDRWDCTACALTLQDMCVVMFEKSQTNDYQRGFIKASIAHEGVFVISVA